MIPPWKTPVIFPFQSASLMLLHLYHNCYTIWFFNIAVENLFSKIIELNRTLYSIFSIATLNHQRVYPCIFHHPLFIHDCWLCYYMLPCDTTCFPLFSQHVSMAFYTHMSQIPSSSRRGRRVPSVLRLMHRWQAVRRRPFLQHQHGNGDAPCHPTGGETIWRYMEIWIDHEIYTYT